jgi:hypothetical protein
MQAARRLLCNAGILGGRRGMTTAAQIAADAKKPHGNLVDTIGVWTVTPLAIGVFIYDMFIHPEVSRGRCGGLAGCWELGTSHSRTRSRETAAAPRVLRVAPARARVTRGLRPEAGVLSSGARSGAPSSCDAAGSHAHCAAAGVCSRHSWASATEAALSADAGRTNQHHTHHAGGV